MFFGRKREMDRLMDMLSGKRPQNVSLVGERRIGKSSLAFRVFHEKGENQEDYPLLF
jgi:AAA+ ATPase superfamily predicted ATPase